MSENAKSFEQLNAEFKEVAGEVEKIKQEVSREEGQLELQKKNNGELLNKLREAGYKIDTEADAIKLHEELSISMENGLGSLRRLIGEVRGTNTKSNTGNSNDLI